MAQRIHHIKTEMMGVIHGIQVGWQGAFGVHSREEQLIVVV